MKYHIDTIPVWDALKTDSECLLCALRRKTERLLVERSLGASVMSPDTRIKVNKTGFCAPHQVMMFNFPGGNRLGHGLMMLSHLQTIRPAITKSLGNSASDKGGKGGFSIFGKPKASLLAAPDNPGSCVICEELDSLHKRQIASLLHLWKTEQAFRTAFSQSKGLCVVDTQAALLMAPEMLNGDALISFEKTARQLLEDSLKRLEEELEWFTLKFDYRNAQKPWNNSRDALERTVNKLRGWCLGSEPMQDE